jgi:hypothetical protein
MQMNNLFTFVQLFDEGHNLVTINLPKAVENLKKKQKEEAVVEKVEEIPVSAPMVSKRVLDVEYDEDYEETDAFNGIESMAQQAQPEPEKPGIRDFSLDVWNGSPGLKHWGFEAGNIEK